MASPTLAPVSVPLPKKRRALVRVLSIAGEEIQVLVPGWNARKRVILRRDVFPRLMQQGLSVGSRFYAYVNMKSSSPKELAESLTDIQLTVPQKELASARA